MWPLFTVAMTSSVCARADAKDRMARHSTASDLSDMDGISSNGFSALQRTEEYELSALKHVLADQQPTLCCAVRLVFSLVTRCINSLH
jgi:hypothetical protein